MTADFMLRPDQENILEYDGGKMGISAVPGSGKTFTLSLLAAEIIHRGVLNDDQEILVVTLVNSAVENFNQRVASFVATKQILPNLGYRVRTLHGLAHDIVRERPELVGLDNNFIIIDEREAEFILDSAVQAWIQSHPGGLDNYLKSDLDEYSLNSIHHRQLPRLITEIASNGIRYAKDLQIEPEHLKSRLEEIPIPLPLAAIVQALYADYQRGLAYRGAVDFDDLIRFALQILKDDPNLLERLRYRWPYILEDEAQDSSRLQEEILSILAGEDGNWVRVGDPNQAIFETFTTANPEFLRSFINQPGVRKAKLASSGRSTKSIIEVANYLIKWSMEDHPTPEARNALQEPYIQMTPSGDPQPNPPDDPQKVWFADQKRTPAAETIFVAESVQKWLDENPDSTVAILAPRNHRAFEVADELRARDIPYTDNLLRSSSTTRFSAGALTHILRYLADPQSSSKLAAVYRVYHRSDLEGEDAQWINAAVELIRKCRYVENYLWPVPGKNWLEALESESTPPHILDDLSAFRDTIRRWQAAVVLPVDQIVLTLAQDLLHEPAELAIAHKLALLLRTASLHHPSWRIPELTGELALIARNERRFLGFASDDTGFDPEKHKGEVVISTIHKAKGLEWDRVYLLSVNNYDFPAGMEGDSYIAEKWFVRDHLNLPAEALLQIDSALTQDQYQWVQEGQASMEARHDYIRERLRLLYVGITRARKELGVTWNSGRNGSLFPAAGLIAIQEYLRQSDMG